MCHGERSLCFRCQMVFLLQWNFYDDFFSVLKTWQKKVWKDNRSAKWIVKGKYGGVDHFKWCASLLRSWGQKKIGFQTLLSRPQNAPSRWPLPPTSFVKIVTKTNCVRAEAQKRGSFYCLDSIFKLQYFCKSNTQKHSTLNCHVLGIPFWFLKPISKYTLFGCSWVQKGLLDGVNE